MFVFYFRADGRNDGDLNVAHHWSDHTIFGSRALLLLESKVSLHIKNVRPTDTSLYKCRVDYKNSPTVNMLINLTVISK